MNAAEDKRVIKRYANRKLYDTEASAYVTHEEIAALVRAGHEVQIIDNRSKEDLTTLTLAQILAKEERRKRRTIHLGTLKSILQTGGERIQERITQQVSTIRGEAADAVENMKSALRPGAEDEPGDTPLDPEEMKAGPEGLDKSERGYETWARTFEERWSLMVNALGHLEDHGKRIAELEARIRQLETEQGPPEETPS